MSNPFRIGNQLVERVLLARAYTDRCSSGCHRGQRSVFDEVHRRHLASMSTSSSLITSDDFDFEE